MVMLDSDIIPAVEPSDCRLPSLRIWGKSVYVSREDKACKIAKTCVLPPESLEEFMIGKNRSYPGI